jgi:hypothetical protein
LAHQQRLREAVFDKPDKENLGQAGQAHFYATTKLDCGRGPCLTSAMKTLVK